MNAIARPSATIAHPPARKSLDQLEEDIISLSQHINASEYEFLVLLREFDLRQGWKAYHFNNCAEWLNMKCGMALNTAREKLRVANALFDLVEISRAFQKGDLSYSKARSLTRVATPQKEAQLLDFALRANAEQVDRHCTGLRNVQQGLSTNDANRARAARHLTVVPNGDGSVRITIELPQQQADLVLKALELSLAQVKDADADYFEDGVAEQVSENDGDAPRGVSALQQRQADGLVEIARSYLAGGEGKTSGGRTGQRLGHIHQTP